MPNHHPTFHQQALADQAWFRANPERSFRVRVLPNEEAATFLASRDGFGSPIFPVGRAVMVTYWRFESATTKAMDHLVLPSASKSILEQAEAVGDDRFALDLLLRARVRPSDVAFSGTPPVIIVDSAA